tara:strand:- start:230 stop:904 length:675 start_codon:yes stop_codon:yes gene_type:complete
MFSFLYNKLYKKIIIFFLALIITLPYINEVPYPLILDIPRSEQIKLTDRWKNLRYPCFKVETLSGNWLSDYSGYFSISDYENFRLNPGLYFGKEIKDYKEKKVLTGYGAEMYSLIQPIDRCVKQQIQRQETHESVFYILGEVKTSICQLHAPHIQSKCESSYLVQSCSLSKTGSMTGINPCTIGIFGMFELKEVGLSIVPLKYFHFSENENDAFNYIWYKENWS